MLTISDKLTHVRQQIQQAAAQYQRRAEEITLLAVSKRQPASAIIEAYHAGQRDFGENYLQEGLDKIHSCSLDGLCWHFIGPIQSNKTRAIAENFHWVHSVDRIKIAQRLNDQRPASLAPLNLCIQVNIDDEQSKSGATPDDVLTLVQAIAQMPRLNLRGLMAIPRASDNPKEQLATFKKIQSLLNAVKSSVDTHAPLDTLSMGMSGDMTAAIGAGSTIVRIGTAIFGARK